ncbi:hypothetical protein BU23DRAFT_252512 [Bimuria novae-zelandiae CBS 107.79]|uniref:Zinc finger PHD-type domain-containing protein n=1 Tax=Bimuria novae-zelandiae CBS 107.79 TaxID=1447943 RepID=A0A6A5VLM2_9PLEO|nr:hypothetical protein BU23DRAFT_252512 [Bimuria novae-zelandiae CBS 107.79]
MQSTHSSRSASRSASPPQTARPAFINAAPQCNASLASPTLPSHQSLCNGAAHGLHSQHHRGNIAFATSMSDLASSNSRWINAPPVDFLSHQSHATNVSSTGLPGNTCTNGSPSALLSGQAYDNGTPSGTLISQAHECLQSYQPYGNNASASQPSAQSYGIGASLSQSSTQAYGIDVPSDPLLSQVYGNNSSSSQPSAQSYGVGAPTSLSGQVYGTGPSPSDTSAQSYGIGASSSPLSHQLPDNSSIAAGNSVRPTSPVHSSSGHTDKTSPRWALYYQELSVGRPVLEVKRGTYDSFEKAFDAAKTQAGTKMAELAIKNPHDDLDVYTDTNTCTYTISVASILRFRYLVEPAKTPVPSYGRLGLGLGMGSLTPSSRGKGIMKIKQEREASPPASVHQYPTPAPEDVPGPQNAAVGTEDAPIEIPDHNAEGNHPGDTEADDDSLFNGSLLNNEAVDSINHPATTPEVTQTAQDSSTPTTHTQQDTNDGLSLSNADTEMMDSSDHPTTTSDATQGTDTPTATTTPTQPATAQGPTHFGIYITMSKPTAPEVTYRIQVNTSLGQAESDMKVIAGNEVDRAKSKGFMLPDDIHLKLTQTNIEIINKKEDMSLAYELVKGAFVDGRFQSDMEILGRAEEETFTAKKMKDMLPPDVTQATVPESMVTEPTVFESTVAGPTGAEPAVAEPAVAEPEPDMTQPMVTEEPSPEPSVSSSRKRSLSSEADDVAPPPESIQSPSKKVKLSSANNTETTPADASDAEDDDALYCRCKQDDDGSDMVGCDGETCPNNGWVHWGCISTKLGKPGDDVESWLCPDCDRSKGKKVYGWKKTAISKGAAAKKAAGTKGVAAKEGVTQKKGGAVKDGGVKKKVAAKKGSAASRRKLIRRGS